MAFYDLDADGGLGALRPRRARPTLGEGSAVKSFSGLVFTETQPSEYEPPVGEPASRDQRYTLAGHRSDLHAYLAPQDPLVAYVRARGAQLSEPAERARTIRGARRRILAAQVTELIVVDARHPRMLQEAEADVAALEADDPHARRRVAGLARQIPGVGGMRVPPTPGGEADGLVIFAPAVAGHVAWLYSRVESAEPVVMRALRGDRVSAQTGATLIDLTAVRRRRADHEEATPKAAGSYNERTRE